MLPYRTPRAEATCETGRDMARYDWRFAPQMHAWYEWVSVRSGGRVVASPCGDDRGTDDPRASRK